MNMLKLVYNSLIAMHGMVNTNLTLKRDNYIVLHCYDGKRFILTCNQEPSGQAYDEATGQPIKE